MAGYLTRIRRIIDGDPVNAGITNAPLAQLQGNSDYLKELMELVLAGSTLFARDKTIAATVQVGQAVFYNVTTQQFEAARASLTTNSSGEMVAAPSSMVWGLVYAKLTENKADILLHGTAPLDLSQVVSNMPVAGMYYLSAADAGKLTADIPNFAIPVCLVGQLRTDGRYDVYVNPNWLATGDAHRHYRFELHAVEAASADEEGWLPADDPVFGDNAPAGAVYGYNVFQASFAALWPPIPTDNAYLEWHTDDSPKYLGMGVTSGNTYDSIVQFTAAGIWWMSDCADEQPWPAEESVSVSECERLREMRQILWFTKPTIRSSQNAVLSLKAVTDSGLVITCEDTDEAATTGHLQIDLELDLLSDIDDEAGHLVCKSYADKQFNRGPIVEAIRAGNGITLTSSLGDPEDDNYQGTVTIAADTELGGTEFAVAVVRLADCSEEFYSGVVALGFSADYPGEFRARLYIPQNVTVPAGQKMTLRFRLLGRAAGTIANDVFTLAYRRIPAAAVLTPTALPTTDTVLTLDFTSVTLSTADQYFDIDSESFEIASGDVVLFTFSRPGGDTYAADILCLEERGILV